MTSKPLLAKPPTPSTREVYIYIQLLGELTSVPAALLRMQTLADGTQLGRFRYGDRYLERAGAVALDPFQLPLGKTVYEFTELYGIPGVVRDAGPDTWGRRVIEHHLERSPADLQEIDYLLHGPMDGAGNLSFGLTAQPPAPKRSYNRTHQLADLIDATQAIDAGEPLTTHLLGALNHLTAGTSLGGARPKATVEDADVLWLAKFPGKGDPFNLQRVEFATLELARRCGLNVAQARLQTVAKQDVLMLQRFDRQHLELGVKRNAGQGKTQNGHLRFGMASAFTLLGCGDSHLDRSRWSYPLLADQLRRWSAKPADDKVELFKRMVFNAAITNNDDHPRNHALLHRQAGWRLSPAYDLLPTPLVSQQRRDLALTVGHYGRTASLYNLLSQSGQFGLSDDEARRQVEATVGVVRQWRTVFAGCGVSEKDMDFIAPAMLPECFFYATKETRSDDFL